MANNLDLDMKHFCKYKLLFFLTLHILDLANGINSIRWFDSHITIEKYTFAAFFFLSQIDCDLSEIIEDRHMYQ